MKKSLILGMTSLLMAGLASCSSDEPIANNDGPLTADQSFYANIQISNTETISRASANDYVYKNDEDPAFDKGTDEENQISSIYLIFYDKDGKRVSTTQVRKDNNGGGESVNDGSGEVIYKGIVQIDVKHGSNKPAYVMCFINPITSANFDINPDFATLESLQATTRPSIIDTKNNFAMSKSVYWGHDRVTDLDNQKIVATPLAEGVQLFDTYAKAESASGSGIVDIYVERYAAKVSLELADKAQKNTIILDNEYTLEFIPEYWAVNAYESSTYICKSFLSDDGDDFTYDELVATLKGPDNYPVWKWNNPDYHRCYWAQSPSYYEEAYPRVADDIYDNGADAYSLGYYSYNEMAKNASDALAAKARKIEGNKETTIYARENTVSGAALAKAAEDANASPKAAIASAVVVGYYKLKKGGQDVDTKMFYVMGNATNGYTVFKNTTEMKNYFVRTTVKFAKDGEGNEFFDYDNGNFLEGNTSYEKYFTVVHPYAASREEVVIDSRFVTIQLTENAKNSGLYALMNNKYVEVTDKNFDEINKQMFYAAGTVQGYNGGKVFYNIPIKHLGFYREGNANVGKTGTESTFDWKRCYSGDFGLVRNHSYSIVIDNIKGLGNGIPNPEDPIVPPTDPEEYFVSARIIVLNWAVVPTQHVEL